MGQMIKGVRVKNLKVIPDERGRLMEMLRADDDIFVKFGQVYLTTVYPGVIKAWHFHRKQTDNLVVAKGMVKLALFDAREKSGTKGEINEFFMGDQNPVLVQIPAGIYHGFKCISGSEALIINIPSEVYNYAKPDEIRLAPDTPEIPYDWSRKDR